jgi:hypothetical protein
VNLLKLSKSHLSTHRLETWSKKVHIREVWSVNGSNNLEDGGDLWMTVASGIIRVPKAVLDHVVAKMFLETKYSITLAEVPMRKPTLRRI